MLVSSFFTAVQSFSSEVIDKTAEKFQVDYGARLFTIFSGSKADLIAVSMGKWDPSIEQVLQDLLISFEKDWLTKISENELDSINALEHFEPFRESVLEKLSFEEFEEDWIPIFISSEDTLPEVSSNPLFEMINGKRTIMEIIEESGIGRDIVMQEITSLWAKGIVRFHNMFDTKDIVIATSRINPLLQSSSAEHQSLISSHPNIAVIIPKLASILDGRRMVGEIIENLSKLHDEKDIFLAFDYLLDHKAVEPLSPERRRILFIKEALEIAYKVAEKTYEPKVVSEVLQNILTQNAASEVIGEVRFEDEKWQIEYDSKIFEGMDPRRIMSLYSDWMKVLAKFVVALDKSKRSKYIENLVNEYLNYLFKWYSPHDFIGFEEFSYWLELICVGKESG